MNAQDLMGNNSRFYTLVKTIDSVKLVNYLLKYSKSPELPKTHLQTKITADFFGLLGSMVIRLGPRISRYQTFNNDVISDYLQRIFLSRSIKKLQLFTKYSIHIKEVNFRLLNHISECQEIDETTDVWGNSCQSPKSPFLLEA